MVLFPKRPTPPSGLSPKRPLAGFVSEDGLSFDVAGADPNKLVGAAGAPPNRDEVCGFEFPNRPSPPSGFEPKRLLAGLASEAATGAGAGFPNAKENFYVSSLDTLFSIFGEFCLISFPPNVTFPFEEFALNIGVFV